MNEEIEFLKSLQKELKEQETDCQASPRFWVIKDYRWVPCNPKYDNYKMSYFSNEDGDFTEFSDITELKDYVIEHILDYEEEHQKYIDIHSLRSLVENTDTSFGELWEFLCDNFNHFHACPVKSEEFICEDTLFLTKEEALSHLKNNSHHYSKDAHTYAMTAWRAPKVEKLWNILENFNWDKIVLQEEAKQPKQPKKVKEKKSVVQQWSEIIDPK